MYTNILNCQSSSNRYATLILVTLICVCIFTTVYLFGCDNSSNQFNLPKAISVKILDVSEDVDHGHLIVQIGDEKIGPTVVTRIYHDNTWHYREAYVVQENNNRLKRKLVLRLKAIESENDLGWRVDYEILAFIDDDDFQAPGLRHIVIEEEGVGSKNSAEVE